MMVITLEDVGKIFLAVLAGGLIGLEREYRDKAAGFRTHIFICLGATLFTILSLKLGGANDAVRIAANIVTGIGFLGAGVILRESGHVVGLTTAAAIWLTSALGMGIGGGCYALALVTTGVALLILWIFPRFENWIDRLREARTYEVSCTLSTEKLVQLEEIFRTSGLYVRSHQRTKHGDTMICSWDTFGPPRSHEHLIAKLMADDEVREIRF